MTKSEEASVFNAAHAHVMRWEGGFFDHPNDPGGVTNYGVSLMFLKGLDLVEGDIDGDGDIDRDDVLKITKEQARAIFKRHFWNKPRAAELPPLVAMAYYDLAVNAGTGRAAIVLQEAINALRPGAIAKLAPNVGPLTRRYAGMLAAEGREAELALAYLDQRENWYRRLAKARPKSAVFLRGWLNRTDAARTLVQRAAKTGLA